MISTRVLLRIVALFYAVVAVLKVGVMVTMRMMASQTQSGSLAWISTSPYYPKSKAGFAGHAVKTSCMSFHQGTLTGLFSNPEASTIGK